MINERALVALMKTAYKAGGYFAYRAEGKVMIWTGAWAILMPEKYLPRKAIGLLAEHMAKLPEEDQVYKINKDCDQAAMTDIADETMDLFREAGKEWAPAGRTKLTYAGFELWQNRADNRLLMVDPEKAALIDLDKLEYASAGERAIYACGDDGEALVFKFDAESEDTRYLESRKWTKEK